LINALDNFYGIIISAEKYCILLGAIPPEKWNYCPKKPKLANEGWHSRVADLVINPNMSHKIIWVWSQHGPSLVGDKLALLILLLKSSFKYRVLSKAQ
jgi:hypothetical protein